ncbi:cell envelope integrity inner membrane protein TolA [Serratia entomophila]|uniref:Cell envelope integrity protein TolA n=1 Tax=Serratia entomophila TaxID=42906 RepID=A0ABY5CZV7_9GAMM|nr:cell envelope integrity protein TolA [Serratia entomophila]UIW20306.1 cell envelope integrity protein TolA [Serratia entomophila]USV02807.1 cell envelope integrity protein TolA [Serratia entomophila]CAI0713831.1 cell envelope integrity inner membrane protein TolA [Serratia entomophila]CAI0723456.1 cell envelope integrity inner membrane protein TolA [Serratia entomophila]CAI0844907.1 cell envelope integrity inner membrane protein TolA [Serratia entomophila]
MKVTYLGCKTGVSPWWLIVAALTLTGGAKAASTSKADPMNQEADDLFASLEGKTVPAPGTEENDYAAQLRSAIENHLKDADAYAGKRCALKITLAPDGLLLGVQAREGDPALCRAAVQAITHARLPKPPTPAVYNAFKSSLLEIRPVGAK